MSSSESRQRTAFLAIRLDEQEMAFIEALADGAGTSKAEVARALIFGRSATPAPVPCSPSHPGCTNHHRALVDGYRDQRYREELALEAETGMHAGDIAFWKENGGRLTTFGDWIRRG